LFIQSAKSNAEHDFSLFYLDQRRQAAFAFCINKPLIFMFVLSLKKYCPKKPRDTSVDGPIWLKQF